MMRYRVHSLINAEAFSFRATKQGLLFDMSTERLTIVSDVDDRLGSRE